MKHQECDCQKHRTVLFGTTPTGDDGVVWIATKTADAVFGTSDDPDSGLVRKVREHEQIKWRVIGACAVLAPIGGFLGAWLMKILTH